MDKVIIYGTFEFLGFHFCNRFLEKGCSVKGIHFDMIGNHYLDEKRLEVGRNANFEEMTIQQSLDYMGHNDMPSIIIFSLYDIFMAGNESILMNKNFFEPICHFLHERKVQDDKLVFLLPIQLLEESGNVKGVRELVDFLKKINEVAKNEQLFYLPAIFGPWQPPAFLFQRIISNKPKDVQESFLEREWIFDAIFIEDALNPIIDTIEIKDGGSYLLESGDSESWNHCADILKLEEKYRKSGNPRVSIGEQTVRLSLKKVTPYHDSLSIQKEHLVQLLRLYG